MGILERYRMTKCDEQNQQPPIAGALLSVDSYVYRFLLALHVCDCHLGLQLYFALINSHNEYGVVQCQNDLQKKGSNEYCDNICCSIFGLRDETL